MVLVKKIGVLLASLVLTMMMAVPVFAAENANPTISTGGSIVIEKNVKTTNDAISQVAGPGVTFKYTHAPATVEPGTVIRDEQGHSSVVTAGPAGGLAWAESGDSLAFTKTEMLNASATGADNKKSTTLNAVADKFTKPGIYRYELSESTNPETLPDGFTNTANQKRYIDVYVTTEGISGMVMHDGSVDAAHKKTFDDAAYVTKNVAIKKVVAGNMADPDATFAFTATVANNDRAFFTGTTEAGATTQVTGTSATATLGNNGELWICGLSTDATVGVSEVNTFGGNTYKATYAVGSGAAQEGTTMAATALADHDVVTFTNTLENVSPTGIVVRFGPYALMLLVAAAFVFILKRTRKADSMN